jgi:hypothetical protein
MNSLRFAIRGLIFTVLLYGFSSYLTTKHWIFPSPIFDFLIVGIVLYTLIINRKEKEKSQKLLLPILLTHSILNLLTSPWVYTFFGSTETSEWLVQSHAIELFQLIAGIFLSIGIYLVLKSYSRIMAITVSLISLLLIFVLLYKFQYFAVFILLLLLNHKRKETLFAKDSITSIYGFMSFLFLCEIANNLM